jgi:hypothetical protein
MNDNDLMRRAIEFYSRSPDGQYDADVVRWLEELQRSRAPDQPSVEHIVAHTDERVSMTLAQYRQLTANQPGEIPCPHPDVAVIAGKCYCCGRSTADQQSVSPTGDKGTIQPDDDISMQDAPQPVDGTGKQSMQACTRNEAGLVQQCEDYEPYDEPHGPHWGA